LLELHRSPRLTLVLGHNQVGVVKQMETAALKKVGANKSAPFTRQLAAVYTKATLVGADVCGLEEVESTAMGQTNFLMCLAERETCSDRGTARLGMVALHCATGDIVYDEWEDGLNRTELEARIAHLCPTELVLPATLTQRTDRVLALLRDTRQERKPTASFDHATAMDVMCRFYKSGAGAGAGTGQEGGNEGEDWGPAPQAGTTAHKMLNLPEMVTCCVGALISHLKQFGLDHALRLSQNVRQFGDSGARRQTAGTALAVAVIPTLPVSSPLPLPSPFSPLP